MKSPSQAFVCLVATSVALGAWAHPASAQTNISASATPTPVAHVYVATPKGVDLYDAASNGKLTLVPGSPFAGNFIDIVINGKYFFGADKLYIYEDAVAPNGALTRIDKFSAGIHADQLQKITSINLDHSGSTLYANVGVDDGMIYQSYSIAKSNGQLNWLGNADKNQASRFGTGSSKAFRSAATTS
jgi:hypothetical protein